MYDCGFRRVGAYPGPGVQARLQCSIDMEEPAWRREAEGAGRGWGMWPTAQDRTGVLGEAVEALLAPALSTPSLSLSRPVSLSCCENPDINELNLPKTCDISFSDPDDLLNFKLVICPDEVRARLTGFSGTAGDTTSSWLVHLPGLAEWGSDSSPLPSQGFYKSGKFVFSFKVSLRWAGVAPWAEEATAEAPARHCCAPIHLPSLLLEPGGPGLPA